MWDLNGTRSTELFFNEGLPQGSAIAPLLFIIFINDIVTDLYAGTQSSLFADDTAIRISEKSHEAADLNMQSEIDKITGWAEKWKINTNKSEVMAISSNTADTNWSPQLHADQDHLSTTRSYRFLGVLIDNDLRFKCHVDRNLVKAKKRINILRCLVGKDWGQSPETLWRLYLTYIRSVLEYANSAW